MNVQLILASGSKMGLKAPIHLGYYMIGRHAECQIRPKSRSVSRRHCLIHHEPNSLKILDLGSTSGLRINEVKVEPKRWYTLNDGDQIRCGKVSFTLSIGEAEESPEPVVPQAETSAPSQRENTTPGHPAATTREPSVIRGEAWQEFDVAGFLENADDADRQQRYAAIRQQDAARRSEEFENDLDVYADTPIEADEATLTELPTDGLGDTDQRLSPTPPPLAGQNAKETKAPGGTTAQRPGGQNAATKNKSVPRSMSGTSSSRFSFSLTGDVERLKLIGAILLTLAVVGFLGWKVYQFAEGPPPRVVEGID